MTCKMANGDGMIYKRTDNRYEAVRGSRLRECRSRRSPFRGSAAGFRQLLELLAEQTQRSEAPIPIAMETAKRLLPAALRAAGYPLFPINPLAVSPYRDRYVVSRELGVSLVGTTT